MDFIGDSRLGFNRADFTVSAGTTSEPLIANVTYQAISVMLSPQSGATASLSYTLSSLPDIENGVALWKAWEQGDVGDITDDTIFGVVTAIRVTSAGGATTVKAVAR